VGGYQTKLKGNRRKPRANAKPKPSQTKAKRKASRAHLSQSFVAETLLPTLSLSFSLSLFLFLSRSRTERLAGRSVRRRRSQEEGVRRQGRERMSSGDDDARVREWRGGHSAQSSWERFHQDQGQALHHRGRAMPSSQYSRPSSFSGSVGGGLNSGPGSLSSSFGRTPSSKQLSSPIHPSQPCVGIDRGGSIISW
jgi:hypothetical protein